jgi:hypothetical protein
MPALRQHILALAFSPLAKKLRPKSVGEQLMV